METGLSELDRRLGGGLRRGSVTCLGAQSGHGKTTLAMQFARWAAWQHPQHASVVLSPEMRIDDISEMNTIAIIGKSREWLGDHPSELGRPHVLDKVTKETPSNLFAMRMPRDVDQPVLDEIGGQLSLMNAEMPLAFVAIDYAQYLIGEIDTGKRQRFALAGDVVRMATEAAERYNCAVLITSQVNPEKHKGKIVDLRMRESALFEHASAAVVYFVREFSDDGAEGDSYMLISKNRYGKLGKIRVNTTPGCYYVKDFIEDEGVF